MPVPKSNTNTGIPSFSQVMGNDPAPASTPSPAPSSIPSFDDVMGNKKAESLPQENEKNTQPTSGSTPNFGLPSFNDLAQGQKSQSDNARATQPSQINTYNENVTNIPKWNKEKSDLKQKIVKETPSVINNAAKKSLKSKGLDPNNNALVSQESSNIKKQIDNGDAEISQGKDGQIGLYNTPGFFTSFHDNMMDAIQQKINARSFAKMNRTERVNFLNKLNTENKDKNGIYAGTKPTPAGTVGAMLGGATPTVGTYAAGAAAGGVLESLAPETMGASTLALKPIMSFIANAGASADERAFQKVQGRYQDNLQKHPEWTHEQSMEDASKGEEIDRLTGIGEAALFSAEGGKLGNTPKTLTGKLLSGTAKSMIEGGSKIAAVEGSGDILHGEKSDKTLSDMAESFKNNIAPLGLLHLVTAGVGGLMNLPKKIENSSKFDVVNNLNPEEINKGLSESVNEGNITPEIAQKTVQDLSDFKMAMDKVPDFLPDEVKAAVTPLIIKRQGIEQEMDSKDPTAKEIYKPQIEAINNQITDIYKNGIPKEEAAPLSNPQEETGTTNASVDKVEQPTEDKNEIGSQVKEKLGNQVSSGTEKDAQDYAIDKVAEAPIKMKNDLGEDLYNKVLAVTPTEKLQENLDYLIKNNPDDPNLDVLDKIISDREKKAEAAPIETIPTTIPKGVEQILGKSEENDVNSQSKNDNNAELAKLLPDTLSPTEKQGSLAGGEANAAATSIVGAIQKANDAAKERGEGLSQEKLKNKETKQLKAHAEENGLMIPDKFGEPKPETKNEKTIVETKEKGNEPPPDEPKVEEDNKEEGDKKIGVSHAELTDLAKKLGLKEPVRGKWYPPEFYAERGRKLLEGGASPDQVNNTANELHDRISIAGAFLGKLVRESDDIAINNPEGIASKEYEASMKKIEEYQNETVKVLGSNAGKAMTSLQVKVDPNSITDMRNTVSKITKKRLSKDQETEIKQRTDKNNKLQTESQKAEEGLVKETDEYFEDKNNSEVNKENKGKPSEYFKKKANDFRKNFKTKPFTFKDSEGNDVNLTTAGITWNDIVEVGAKAIEVTGKIADGVAAIVDKVKDSDWYKKLSDKDKDAFEDQLHTHFGDVQNQKDVQEAKVQAQNVKRLEKELEEAKNDRLKKTPEKRNLSQKEVELQQQIKDEQIRIQLDNLQKQFVDKKDSKFSFGEAKSIWQYAKKAYLDKDVSYRDMLSAVKSDLGLTWRQVSDALTSPKVKPKSDEMWRKEMEYRKSQNATRNWVEEQDKTKAGKLLAKVSGYFRGIAVFGHGGIFVGTHSGMTVFQPSTWNKVIPAFINGYKFAYGDKAAFARRMEELKNRDNYIKAQVSGLKNNVDVTNAEEYEKSQKYLGKLGDAGERGFNAIKVLRQDLWDYHYNKLSAEAKGDKESLENISKLVNNATGATNLKTPSWYTDLTFAGGMESARWGKIFRNPAKASYTALSSIKDMVTGNNEVSTADKVFAKVWASRVGEQLATFSSMLLANAALQHVINPNNPTNLTNPNAPDFLKFKFGDVTIDPTSGMRSAFGFIYGMGKIPFKKQSGDNVMKQSGYRALGYLRGKANPFYSTVSDFYFKTDYNGNVMPTSSDKPRGHAHRLSWVEYGLSKAPLPLAEAIHVTYQSAIDNGANKPLLNSIAWGAMSGAISGTTGFRVGEFNKEEYDKKRNHSLFDNTDKNPTFNYYLNKGVEAPQIKPTQDPVNDLKNKKVMHVSDFPQPMQDQYNQKRKEILSAVLSKIQKDKYVYRNQMGKISLYRPDVIPPKGKTKVLFSSLSNEELKQIMTIGETIATPKAKNFIFYKKNKDGVATQDLEKLKNKEPVVEDSKSDNFSIKNPNSYK